MFGPVGWQEILLILALALLVFGPRRLPELGRTLGRALGEFRRATTDLKRTLNAEIALEEGERSRSPRRPELAAASSEPADPPDPDGGPHREPARPPAATMPRGAEALDLAGVVDDGEEERAPRPPAPSTGSGESSGGGAASPDAEAGTSSAAEASDAGEPASDAAPDDSHRRDAPATTH
jgi:sec-independent protein translocase protein TatB